MRGSLVAMARYAPPCINLHRFAATKKAGVMKYPRRDSNQFDTCSGKASILERGGATGGALDAQIRRIEELWPTLNQATRQRLLAIAEGQSL